MQYVQVNKSYVLDTKTNKLQPLSGLRGVAVDTPWWLWQGDIKESTMYAGGNTFHEVASAVLNNLMITMHQNRNQQGGYASQCSPPTAMANIYPVITFKDKTGKVDSVTIDHILSVSGNDFQRPMAGSVGSVYPAIIAGATYNIITSAGARRYTMQLQHGLNDFAKVKNLQLCTIFNDENINRCYNFNFGLSEKQFEVIYQGRPLDGTCYAYLLGTYAILLRDDFSFDSLAALSGCKDGVLKVERFLFSTNSFIQSLMGWG